MVLAFGDHRLDIARRELRRGEELVALEPKAFDLLAFLVHNRNRVVGKDDLLRAVWEGRIVSESALTTRINAVRRALGDDGAAQRLIRTFRRKGIRFVGEVTELSEARASADARPPVNDAAAGPAPPPDKPSLAVLPFQNMSGDPEQDYFVDGMVEEIITALSRIRWMFVIARNSTFTYQSKAVDVKQVARELGVRYVLEGSVRRFRNQVRITGQLIDTATAAHIWADRFEGTLDDIFDLQDRVASSVAGAIEPKLRSAEIERTIRKPTENLDAYDLFLRAWAKALQRTERALTESVALAHRAVKREPGYALAMALISACRVMQCNRRWIPDDGPEVEEGIAMARQAVAIAKEDPEVLTIARYALAYLAGETEAALSAFERAIAFNPNFAPAYAMRALVLAWLGRPEETIVAAQQAMRISPLDPQAFLWFLALAAAHMVAGRYEEALAWAECALSENAGVAALRQKLVILGHLGRLDEAEKCLRLLREVHPEPTVAGIMRGMPKGSSTERRDHTAEGLRKAGLPEE